MRHDSERVNERARFRQTAGPMIENPSVGGSISPRATKNIEKPPSGDFFVCLRVGNSVSVLSPVRRRCGYWSARKPLLILTVAFATITPTVRLTSRVLGWKSLTFVHFFQRPEDAVGARIDADRRNISPANHAFLIDDEQGPFAHPFPGPIYAIVARNLALGLEVGQQRKPVAAVLAKSSMAPSAVDENDDTHGLVFRELVAQLVVSWSPQTGLQSAG